MTLRQLHLKYAIVGGLVFEYTGVYLAYAIVGALCLNMRQWGLCLAHATYLGVVCLNGLNGSMGL